MFLLSVAFKNVLDLGSTLQKTKSWDYYRDKCCNAIMRMLQAWNEKTAPKDGLFLEVTPGFEPGIWVLQTRALPLGYATILCGPAFWPALVG